MKILSLIIFVFGLLVQSLPASAAILYLKDGTTAEGKILDRNSYSITIDRNGVPAKFFNDQVERILEDKDYGSNPLGVQATKLDPAAARKTNLILSLLEANGTIEKMRLNVENIVAKSGVQNEENLRNLFNINEMSERLVPIYSEYYSEAELEALVKFYQSPLGKKLLENTPIILEKVMNAHVNYFQEKLPQK